MIDTVPRPDGLSPEQQAGLERLARQVVALLDARRDTLDLRAAFEARNAAEAARALTERRWIDVYRNMDQGFILGHALRDDEGQVTDWRYVDVNRAWGEQVGIDPDAARGRTIRELFPGIEEEWIANVTGVVGDHHPRHFTRQVGTLDRWYDGVVQWVGDSSFTTIFHEVTDRVMVVRRRAALLELADALRVGEEADGMIARATRIVGEALGASRVVYAQLDHTRELVDVQAGWSLPGMPSVEGRHALETYGPILCEACYCAARRWL